MHFPKVASPHVLLRMWPGHSLSFLPLLEPGQACLLRPTESEERSEKGPDLSKPGNSCFLLFGILNLGIYSLILDYFLLSAYDCLTACICKQSHIYLMFGSLQKNVFCFSLLTQFTKILAGISLFCNHSLL